MARDKDGRCRAMGSDGSAELLETPCGSAIREGRVAAGSGGQHMPSRFAHRVERNSTLETAQRRFVARVAEDIFQDLCRAPLPSFKRAFAACLGNRYHSAMTA